MRVELQFPDENDNFIIEMECCPVVGQEIIYLDKTGDFRPDDVSRIRRFEVLSILHDIVVFNSSTQHIVTAKVEELLS